MADGTPFGRYLLMDLLGRGGMGEVWRAHDIETRRVVALKLLSAAVGSDQEFVERFRREAHAAAELNDPHVVPIHHFGEIQGRLYVDMRLIEGTELKALIAQGPLDPARAVGIVEQVASALHNAHRVGLVHRDVKPSNILVAENDFAYLIDFGIAQAAGESRLTGEGQVIGTFAYMAPERLARGEADPRSDIYALACVLHECLTGSQPFPGPGPEQQIGGHLNAPPPRPSAIRVGVPVGLDAVIATAMSKDPARRFATAKDFAAAARGAITSAATLPANAGVTEPLLLAHPRPGRRAATKTPDFQPLSLGAPPAFAGGPPVRRDARWAPRPSRVGTIVVGAAALITVIGVVLALSLIHLSHSARPHAGATKAALPNTGPFTGSYSVDFGPQLDLKGKEVAGAPPPYRETWNLRSQCGGGGCVATAVRASGSAAHPTNLVLDQIGERWTAVDVRTGTCHEHSAEEWNIVWLQQLTGGTMSGEWITDSVDCYSKRAVTFVRNGDTDVAGLSDPAARPARLASPAQGLHGAYHSKFTVDNGNKEAKPSENDFNVDTFCQRSAARCISRFLTTNSAFEVFLFAKNTWTRDAEYDSPCAGKTSHVKLDGDMPLPPAPGDPIKQLSGHGRIDESGATCKGGAYEQVFNRTGG